ncbi:MAG: hypothetical protein ACLSVD_02545 [Eggerthellaceae bacterium]
MIEDVAGMDFASFEDLDATSRKLVAYNAIGSEGRPARWTLFKERELPQMLELPSEDADFATWSTRSFGTTTTSWSTACAIRRHGAARTRKCASAGPTAVRSYLNGELVARHERMTRCGDGAQ